MNKKRTTVPLQAPEYRGGKKAMLEFIQKNLRYPQEALDHKIEGTVEVSYIVNGLGKIVEVSVLKGIGYGCDEEAIRLVKSLVYEKAYNRGMNTRTKRAIKIHFKLPKRPQVKLNYNIVSDKPKQSATPPTSKTYQIRVNIPKKS